MLMHILTLGQTDCARPEYLYINKIHKLSVYILTLNLY